MVKGGGGLRGVTFLLVGGRSDTHWTKVDVPDYRSAELFASAQEEAHPRRLAAQVVHKCSLMFDVNRASCMSKALRADSCVSNSNCSSGNTKSRPTMSDWPVLVPGPLLGAVDAD
jgi:hypothetical protein